MKKVLLSLALLLPTLVYAQDTYKAYAELLGFQKGLFSNKVKVNVDFGQDVSFWKAGDMRIVSEDGKDVVFNSMVDAMNFMGKCGWEFVQAYVVTEGNQNVYHWLLSKDVTCEDDIKAGFNVKADFKGVNTDPVKITYYRKTKKETAWNEIKTETLKDVTPEQLDEIVNNWKSQESDKYDYECKVSRGK